jgi:hypothetical protein
MANPDRHPPSERRRQAVPVRAYARVLAERASVHRVPWHGREAEAAPERPREARPPLARDYAGARKTVRDTRPRAAERHSRATASANRRGKGERTPPGLTDRLRIEPAEQDPTTRPGHRRATNDALPCAWRIPPGRDLGSPRPNQQGMTPRADKDNKQHPVEELLRLSNRATDGHDRHNRESD